MVQKRISVTVTSIPSGTTKFNINVVPVQNTLRDVVSMRVEYFNIGPSVKYLTDGVNIQPQGTLYYLNSSTLGAMIYAESAFAQAAAPYSTINPIQTLNLNDYNTVIGVTSFKDSTDTSGDQPANDGTKLDYRFSLNDDIKFNRPQNIQNFDLFITGANGNALEAVGANTGTPCHIDIVISFYLKASSDNYNMDIY